ncbi:MAG: ATP-dependent DNA helicase RecG [Clostridia bacterium]|nr:ATP-dependent DNA helicase RecG [Clostridia bacterium]
MPAKKGTKVTPSSPVDVLPGISEARRELFQKLGIETLSDLCHHYPRSYEMRGRTTTVAEAKNGEIVSLILTVATQPQTATIRRGMVLTKFRAFDDTGSVGITYFNQAYLKSTFQVGSTFRFYGYCERSAANTLQMASPKHEPLPINDPGDGSMLPPILPIYKTTATLTQKLLSDAVQRALPVLLSQEEDCIDTELLPDDIRDTYDLCTSRYALQNIHMPPDEASLDAARKRLVFEELLLFFLHIRQRQHKQTKQSGLPLPIPDMNPFYAQLPYRLTGAQMRAIEDFICDMTEPGRPPMNRLLSGDVGSGKTVCAAAALYIALSGGYQAALMAPTEILATQHYEDLLPMFSALGYSCALLVGSTKPKEKKKIKDQLALGELRLVIGTHALLENDVSFSKCGLIVIDEQHRFGVGQRAQLANKAEKLHTLIMSATPIPRTMALMLYGDNGNNRSGNNGGKGTGTERGQMSVLDEMPPGRQKVSTFAVDESLRARLNGFIRRQAEEGHQVYIVCPAIDETEEDFDEERLSNPSTPSDSTKKPTLKAAVAYAQELQNNIFPDLNVGFLHGKMKPQEKDDIMHCFAGGTVQILVSTTVIEVGVNVPNATLMVVENAELFGLSQLHQLRGRVGRGRDKSWCILVSNAKNETAQKRLSILCHSGNGYEIAEQDLALRGPGDFFAAYMDGTSQGDMGTSQRDMRTSSKDVRQSGGLRFEIASLCDDMALVGDAVSAADRIMADDPDLQTEPYRALKKRLSDEEAAAEIFVL